MLLRASARVVLLLAWPAAAAAPVTLSNDRFALRFDPITAAILDARAADGVRLAGGPAAPVDVLADKAWRFSDKSGRNLLRVQTVRADAGGGFKRLTFDCAAPGWEVRIVYELPARGAWLRRRARWKYVGRKPTRVDAVRFYLPGVRIDHARDCAYTLPSLWPPRDVAFGDLRDGRILAANMWNSVPPAVVVHNRRRRIGLADALFTTQEAFEILARERAGRIDVENRLRVRAVVKPGQTIALGDEYLALARGDMLDAIRACKQIYRLAGFRPAAHAKWTRGASMYSLPAGGTQTSGGRDLGGFANFRKYILPRLQWMGFDVVWFLPTNPGGYAPTDYFTTNPRYGSLDDLRALCADAHQRGLRIFLDLIPHGPKEHSPAGREILPARADWVMRDEHGAMRYRWGCLACDYAHPGWQDYMARVATFFVKRCDIDGWRVDVAGGWSPNWRPWDGLRPSQSSPYGALGLLQKCRTEMQKLKPDVAMLGEISSWLFLGPCDYIYDWTFERTLRALVKMRPEQWAPLVQEWLERRQAALPEGAEFGLMRFLENHDQWKAVWYWGPGHHKALLSLCALTPGLLLVFSDEDIGFGEHIRWLNDLRERLPEMAKGRALYTATKCDAPAVVAFTRAVGRGFSVVAINFSGRDVRTRVRLPLRELGLPLDARYAQHGLYQKTKPAPPLPPRPLRDWESIDLSLVAYGTRVVTFRPVDEPMPFRKEQSHQVAFRGGPLVVTTSGRSVTVSNRFYRLTLKDGLISELRTADDKRALVTGMNVVEGRRKVWPGPRLDFARVARAEPQVEQNRRKNEVVVTYRGRIRRTDSVEIGWTARYRCAEFGPVEVEMQLDPPRSRLPVCGELGVEVRFGQARGWSVPTFAGELRDRFDVTHPLGDLMRGWKYWHRSGLLWEAAQLPPAPVEPYVAAWASEKEPRRGVRLELPQFLKGFENAYLRERDSRGRPGLTLCLAWLDQKGRTTFDKPLRARFRIHIDGGACGAGELRGSGWSFAAEGANYVFKNQHYELVLGKSRGGGVFGFASAGAAAPVIDAANVYSDYGIYRDAKTPDGRIVKDAGISNVDYETDARFWREGDGLVVEFQSFLRSRYRPRNVAAPRVEYRLRYRLDASPRVRVECAVRPLLTANALRAFLAQTLSLPGAREWRVKLARGEAAGLFGSARGRRVWESTKQPLGPASEINVLFPHARLRFSDLRAPADQVQNVFLLDTSRGGGVAFFAFFSGQPTDYRPSWRRVSYVMEARKR